MEFTIFIGSQTKNTLWQGGVKSASFIWSSRLQQNRRVSKQLMHVTDWLPTLYSAAGTSYVVTRAVVGYCLQNVPNNIYYATTRLIVSIYCHLNKSEISACSCACDFDEKCIFVYLII